MHRAGVDRARNGGYHFGLGMLVVAAIVFLGHRTRTILDRSYTTHGTYSLFRGLRSTFRTMRTAFRDRTEAGEILAEQLREYEGRADTVILALPRGGVPVGFEIATKLQLPLDVFVVRKLGVPGQRELAMGAIASGGLRILNEDVLNIMPHAAATVAEVTSQEAREVERRERDYRQDRPPLEVGGRTIILVDDGLATGATMLAAVAALREKEPSEIVVAVPVCPPETLSEIERVADRTVI